MASIQFKIDGSSYGTATATTFELDGTTKKNTYTAGAGVTIEIDDTTSPTVLFQAKVKDDYASYFTFEGWYTTESWTDSTTGNAMALNGIKDNEADFSYNVVEHGTGLVRADFSVIESMLVNVSVLNKNTTPSIAGVKSTSGGGARIHKEVLEITANLESGYVFNDGDKWAVVSIDRDTGTSYVEHYDTSAISYTVDGQYSSVTFTPLVSKVSTSTSDFTLSSSTVAVGGSLTIALSSDVYKQGCKCKWLLLAPGNNTVNNYDTYGEDDWLEDIWSSYSTPSTAEGVVSLTLPFPARLTEIFSKYSSDLSSLACKLMVNIDTSGYTGTGTLTTLTEPYNYRDVTLTIPDNFRPAISNVNVNYDKLFSFVPTGADSPVNLLIAGWSRFMGGYKVESVNSQVGGGGNYLSVNTVSLVYNGNNTADYTHGEDYYWGTDSEGNTYGSGAIGNTYYVTIGENKTALQNFTVDITATNTAGISTTYNYTNSSMASPIVYGWYEPIYNLIEIYRCDSEGIMRDDPSLNNRIYMRFSLECAPIVYNSIDYNYIETFSDGEEEYAKSTSLRLTINGGDYGTDNKIVAEGNNIYHVLIGTGENPLDFNANYTLCLFYKDSIKRYFDQSTVDSSFFFYAQPVCANMPLSLYQDNDTNAIGAGLAVQATNSGYLEIGTDSVFNTDVKITASKTVLSPEGSGTNVVTTQVNAYDLVAKGDTVCVPEADIENGLYVNNVRVMTKANYINIQEPDEHTMFICI